MPTNALRGAAAAVIAASLSLALLPPVYARGHSGDAMPVKEFRVIHTADGLGELLPCGWSDEKLGGLARRAETIRAARKKGVPVLVVESGDFLFKRRPPEPGAVGPARAAAAAILRAYLAMGYDAVLPGETDFLGGVDLLREFERKGVPFTCLNLVVSRTGEPVFRPFRKASLGGTSVVVTGVIGESVIPPGFLAAEGWSVLPPGKALDALLAREADRGGVTVVLSHLGGAGGDRGLLSGRTRPVLVFGAHSERPGHEGVPGTGAFLFHAGERGTRIVDVVVGRPVRATGRAGDGFEDARQVAARREQRLKLAEELRGMDARGRKIYGKALEAIDNAIRAAEGKRWLDVRIVPLGAAIPDDPEVRGIVEGLRAGARRPGER